MNGVKGDCVYQHRRLDTGEIFYIGRGVGRRPWCKNRHKEWKAVVKVTDYVVEIVKDGLTYEESNELEQILINMYGRVEFDGILVNRTDGGERNRRLIHSAETRRKIGEAAKGRTFSAETLSKMSEAAKGRIFSAYTLKKRSMSRAKKRQFYAFDKTTGEIVGTFMTTLECREELFPGDGKAVRRVHNVLNPKTPEKSYRAHGFIYADSE